MSKFNNDSLSLCINGDMNNWLEEKSSESGMTVTALVNDILTNFKHTFQEDSVDFLTYQNNSSRSELDVDYAEIMDYYE